MKVGKGTLLSIMDNGETHNFIREEAAKKFGLKFVPTQDLLKVVNSPPDKVISIVENVEVRIGEWSRKIDFTVVQMDDYKEVLGIEFMKQYEVVMVPHMKKLYIYDGREDEPLRVPVVVVMTGGCKLTRMNMEDIKQDEEVYERLKCVEEKLIEKEEIMRAFFDSVLDLIGRLEVVEDNMDVNPKTH